MRRVFALLLIGGFVSMAAVAAAQEEATEEEASKPLPTAAPPVPGASTAPTSAPPEPKSLDELLQLVRQGFQAESEENKQREAAFKAAKERQAQLLAEASAIFNREEALSQQLEAAYNHNEDAIAENEADLAQRLGNLGELFGVVRQVATDTSGTVWESLTSSQLGPRKELLDRLGRSKELPTTEDLEKLWYELQLEMTAQGQVVRYSADVLTLGGSKETLEVVRAGPFSAVLNGRYLLWESSDQQLRELTRQPPARYVNTVAPFEGATEGFEGLAVDPSRGQLLNALTDTPSPVERVQQGGAVGAVIITLGIAAFLLGVWRWLVISNESRKVNAQRKSDRADSNNPLGRVIGIYEQNKEMDAETLELKLDEAVMRESSSIEKFVWLVKVVSVVAPLLGLLGTVTGMIQTFQAITLFGAGDPKMMAGGISEALVTTMLGLITAIPLVLLHATLANSTRRIIDTLDEQSAGLIAVRSEQSNA